MAVDDETIADNGTVCVVWSQLPQIELQKLHIICMVLQIMFEQGWLQPTIDKVEISNPILTKGSGRLQWGKSCWRFPKMVISKG